jgi:hypothetical protein
MKSGGGKQKGSSFEREICKKLSEWVSDGKSDDLFWRSAMSGGRATVRSKKGQKTASGQGDITAVAPEGNRLTDRFVIECKHYKTMGLDQHIYGQGPLADIWDKLRKECGDTKRPMLIFKENRRPILVGLDFKCLGLVCLVAVFWSDLHLYHIEDVTNLPFFSFKFLGEK